MPIDINIFNRARKKRILILEFLYHNQNEAFSYNEIIKQIGFDKPEIDINRELDLMVRNEYIDKEKIGVNIYYAIAKKGIEIIEKNKDKK